MDGNIDLQGVQIQLKALEDKESGDVPSWAKEAIDAAVANKVIDTPKGSVDFYRLVTILHRLKLFGGSKAAN